MVLTSMRRLRAYVAGMTSGTLEDTLDNNRLLQMWNMSVSRQVEQYIDRGIEIESRIQFFDVGFGMTEYFTLAYPITTITSTESDSTGEFDGAETTETNEYIGTDARSVVLNLPFRWKGKRGLKITYTGGFAYHAVNNTCTIVVVSGSWTAGKFVIGATSGAVGVVVSQATTTLVIESYYGEFVEGETLTEYTGEDATAPTSTSATLTSIDRPSLVQAYSDIVMATEAQIRYYWEHTRDFENAASQREGTTTRRRTATGFRAPLQDEPMALLQPYVRIR